MASRHRLLTSLSGRCGPCHAIAPVYEELSKTYTPKGVTFLKCDVDAAKEVAQTYAVSAMCVAWMRLSYL